MRTEQQDSVEAAIGQMSKLVTLGHIPMLS